MPFLTAAALATMLANVDVPPGARYVAIGCEGDPAPAGDVLRRMREGLTDRINQRGGYAVPESRVHPSIWGHVGTPRVILYPGQVRLLPRSARARVEHRVYRADEW